MAKFAPDYSLIVQWNKSLDDKLPFEPPFVCQFSLGNKRLHYLAANHEGGTESPNLKTVKWEFDEFDPDVVIVEGLPNMGEKSPAWYLEHCQEQAKGDFAVGGEGAYATVLAAERNIDFIPGEPSPLELCKGMVAQGYTIRDLVGWETATAMQHFMLAGAVSEAGIAAFTEQYASDRIKEKSFEHERFNYSDFCAWYQERMGEEFCFATIAAIDCSPSRDGHANFLQRITSATDNVREPHILKIIAEQLDEFDKVLVVFGSGHAGKQERVLSKMLGPVRHLKPF